MLKRFVVAVVLMSVSILVAGCVTDSAVVYQPPQPSSMEPAATYNKTYSFLDSNKYITSSNISSLYIKDKNNQFALSAFITTPINSILTFNGSSTEYAIPDVDARPLQLKEGVYPFEITPFPTTTAYLPKNSHLSGAMVVFNLDMTVELASFGKNDETRLFKPDLIEKALKGILTEGIISFDEKARIVYWIGNRKHLYAGGEPIVEVDFSKNPGITELKVNDKVVDDFIAEVPVYVDFTTGNKSKKDNEFTIKFNNGGKFKGYIRNIEDNPTTAFVKIPCTLPQNLLDAAAKGTISKLKILSDGKVKDEAKEDSRKDEKSPNKISIAISDDKADDKQAILNDQVTIAEVIFGLAR